MYSRQAGRLEREGWGRRRAALVLPNRMAGFTSLIMQADMLWGELWYQHAASDMGSGPQGRRRGPLEDKGVRKVGWRVEGLEFRETAEDEEVNLHKNE